MCIPLIESLSRPRKCIIITLQIRRPTLKVQVVCPESSVSKPGVWYFLLHKDRFPLCMELGVSSGVSAVWPPLKPQGCGFHACSGTTKCSLGVSQHILSTYCVLDNSWMLELNSPCLHGAYILVLHMESLFSRIFLPILGYINLLGKCIGSASLLKLSYIDNFMG